MEYWSDGPPWREFQGIRSYSCNVMAASPSELRHANQVWARGSKEFGAIEIDFIRYYPAYHTIPLFRTGGAPNFLLKERQFTLFGV